MFDSISSLLRSREAGPSLILSRESAFLLPWFLFLYTPWCWVASMVFCLSWSSDSLTALNVAIEFWLWFRSNTYISTNFIFIRVELRFWLAKLDLHINSNTFTLEDFLGSVLLKLWLKKSLNCSRFAVLASAFWLALEPYTEY